MFMTKSFEDIVLVSINCEVLEWRLTKGSMMAKGKMFYIEVSAWLWALYVSSSLPFLDIKTLRGISSLVCW